ncbi:MAG: DUF6340 family protein [Bacteroidota bacterium]
MQKIAVDLYTSPRVEYPPELRTIMMTSRYVPATGPYEDIQWGAYESVDSAKWALSESFIDSLAKDLIKGNHFLVKVRHNPRMLKNNTASLPESQPWDGMAALAKKEYVQGIFVLEGFDLTQKDEVVSSPDGGFVASRKADITLAIRVYEPDKRRFAEDSVYVFTRTFLAKGNTGQEALKALPDPQITAALAIDYASGEYARLVIPGSSPADRLYYKKGDSLMLVADTALQKGNWGRAESKWTRLAYESKDTLVQALASYNMALACERNGRLNQAIGYAKRSERLKSDKKTREYINLLEAKMAAYLKQVNDKIIIRNW